MTTRILFAGTDAAWPAYQPLLEDQFEKAGLEIDLGQSTHDPETVDYIIYAPNGPVQDLGPFINAKLVQSLWAGVEIVLQNPTLTHPLARMVDVGMSQGMAAYVTGHVLRHHLETPRFAAAQPGDWQEETGPPLPQNRKVGVLGIGELGLYCARELAKVGFDVLGWSRSQKEDDMVSCHAGDAGLRHVLEVSDILVLLLPQTDATNNILNEERIGWMKTGATIINPGRGPLIDDDALIDALKTGKISQATLDVFRTEPLPAEHPYWHLPNVLVTPHVASETRVETSASVVVENILRGERGDPFLHLVDRSAGY
jgi:glyoxylate/hydroxypyruvate reductase A